MARLRTCGARLITSCLFILQIQPGTSRIKTIHCPAGHYLSIVEKHLVKSDPGSFLKGTFLEYFVSPPRDPPHCAATTYSAGWFSSQITSKSVDKPVGQPQIDSCTETQEVVKTGVYSIDGTVLSGEGKGTQYTGTYYVFYADSNVLGYYFCQNVEDTDLNRVVGSIGDPASFNAAVTVKKDKVKGLVAGTDKTAIASLNNAKHILQQIADEMNSAEDTDLINRRYRIRELTQVPDNLLDCNSESTIQQILNWRPW